MYFAYISIRLGLRHARQRTVPCGGGATRYTACSLELRRSGVNAAFVLVQQSM